MSRTIVAFILAMLLLAGIVLLQIFLSKRENKWSGLALPGMAFLFGLLFPLNMAVPSDGVSVGFLFQMFLVWLLGNLPTVLLLAIYFACRGKQRRKKQLDKMNIQDLG